MKVLLVNGSPHREGCIFHSLSEIAETLRKNDVESEVLWIGAQPVRGCIGCWQCRENNNSGCVFRDKLYNDFIAGLKDCDGLIIGSPVYFAGPSGSLCAILDRVCFSAPQYFIHKPAACVVNCRRGGASTAFDRLNKYFTILQMPVVSSQYWNSTHGMTPDELQKDQEGLQTMRTLAANMAHLLHSYAAANIAPPIPEMPRMRTNFIS